MLDSHLFVRLDQFLKLSRLVSRRTVARQFCDAGRVSVNGQPAKASKEIKVGDEIEIRKVGRTFAVRVMEVPMLKQVSKNAAADLVEIREVRQNDELST